ncbi:C2H2-type domain-containing protein [Mycena chlorophos]|uniref:C2H2-type domain-containing protein n=1 Tax=Mycena chlorophos TaxID=658473 RepID=A0A8H6SB00_MYCCL|nr:C2H2-type domain-containing protein [Mycena chlorophos]
MAPYYECTRCNRDFYSLYALREHERQSDRHWICNEHDLDFSSWLGLKEHFVQSRAHSYCQYCDEHFDDEGWLEEHYQQEHDYCSPCGRVFKNETGLHEHRRQSPLHHYCASCRRLFVSAANLTSHLNSSIHVERTIRCPGRGCTQTFINVSSMTAHLEAGACVSGMTRQGVNRFVRENDRRNLITDPSRLITAGDGRTNTLFSANEHSWNGYGYECYLCHREFTTLAGLNQHLASPKHEEKVYICRGETCMRRFQTLSSLWSHLESEKCGVTRFGSVRRAMDELVGGMQRARIGY